MSRNPSENHSNMLICCSRNISDYYHVENGDIFAETRIGPTFLFSSSLCVCVFNIQHQGFICFGHLDVEELMKDRGNVGSVWGKLGVPLAFRHHCTFFPELSGNLNCLVSRY